MLVCVDTIYADSLFALNLIADYALLIAAGRTAGAVLRRWRIALAAVVGSAYALAAVVPKWGFFTHPVLKIALGVGMCLIAYGSERRFWRCCGMFFAVSALFGGAVWGASMLAGYDASGPAYVPVSWRVLVLSFAVCYAAVTLFLRRAGPKARRGYVQLAVTLLGKTVTLRALADTGNALADPVSGRAAAVCEARALSPLTGPVDASDAVGALEALSALPGLAGRVVLLPYSSVGARGLLAAIRPDAVTVDGRDCSLLVALSPEGFGADYEAIVPAEF